MIYNVYLYDLLISTFDNLVSHKIFLVSSLCYYGWFSNLLDKHKSGSTCEMRFLNSTAQLVEPAKNEKFASFNLEYVEVEDKPLGSEYWEPRFAGHQSLQEREESYLAHDQQLNCAFVKGPNGTSTGFDISEENKKYMSKCHIAVSSCIFGNSDRLRTPFGKTVCSFSVPTNS